MICECGGRTIGQVAREDELTLRWEECTCCGRCGGFRLKIDGQDALLGEAARRSFRDRERAKAATREPAIKLQRHLQRT